MGRIQSSVGLVSGVPIADTVEQLIALSARPRDLLQARNEDLKARQVALGELTAVTIAVELSTAGLGKTDLFQQLKATSSSQDLLGASVVGEPAAGSYTFTPLRRASQNQLISSGVAARDEAIGTAGSFTFRFGGFVDDPLALDQLNGGQGVVRGKIRITDRSGTSGIIDFSQAVTAKDVVETINSTDGINVSARLVGDRIELTDQTGSTLSNLIVQEVNGGRTAADLGLGSINVAASTATGGDLVRLHDDLAIGLLNDGNGVSFQNELADLDVSLADGSTLTIDFQTTGNAERTLGDLIATINAADPAKLQAQISADGDRLELVDLTSGSATFQVTSLNGGSVAEDLGLTNSASGGTITSRRLLGGLGTSLLSTLKGGSGVGTLGLLSLTDRGGGSASVDLSSAQTLDDVIESINASSVAINARLNTARNGIELVDTSGSSVSNLIVANGDATNTADALGLTVNAAQDAINSGSLDRQIVSEQTKLEDLNYGKGVSLGSILITDSAGEASGINLQTNEAKTLGDVIDLINGLSIGVQATINDTGDGLLLIDTAGGGGVLTVEEAGSGTTAADLGIVGTASSILRNGTTYQGLDGATTVQIDIAATDTLEDVVAQINDLDVGVEASILNDGSAFTPFRLSLFSKRTGSAGAILADATNSPFSFQELAPAQDALIAFGSGGTAILASSSGNEFTTLVDGLSLQVGRPTGESVTVTVDADDSSLLSKVGLFVDSFNKVVEKIDSLTFYNEADKTTGLLFGSYETLRLQSDLSDLVTGRFAVDGAIRSLGAVGISVRDDGTLELDEEKLAEVFEQQPDDVEKLFTDETFGFAARFKDVLDSLSGEENSLLINRNESLQKQIDGNSLRLETMDKLLEAERARLYTQFIRMEEAIAKFQSSTAFLSQIRAVPALSLGQRR